MMPRDSPTIAHGPHSDVFGGSLASKCRAFDTSSTIDDATSRSFSGTTTAATDELAHSAPGSMSSSAPASSPSSAPASAPASAPSSVPASARTSYVRSATYSAPCSARNHAFGNGLRSDFRNQRLPDFDSRQLTLDPRLGCLKMSLLNLDGFDKLRKKIERPKKQVSFVRQRGANVPRSNQPSSSPRVGEDGQTPAAPSTPPRTRPPRRNFSPPPPARASCDDSFSKPERTDCANTPTDTSATSADGEVQRSVSTSPSATPNMSPRVRNHRATCPVRRPKDFPREFEIQPKIEEFEKRADSCALDEETLKRFDVANRQRRLGRSQTLPDNAIGIEDDWWGVQSAPSDGSAGGVMCEVFAIGTPPGGRSRASSVCSLGSIYSRSSRASSRSRRSGRSAISQSSLYYCSNNSSKNSMYSSNGSLYDA